MGYVPIPNHEYLFNEGSGADIEDIRGGQHLRVYKYWDRSQGGIAPELCTVGTDGTYHTIATNNDEYSGFGWVPTGGLVFKNVYAKYADIQSVEPWPYVLGDTYSIVMWVSGNQYIPGFEYADSLDFSETYQHPVLGMTTPDILDFSTVNKQFYCYYNPGWDYANIQSKAGGPLNPLYTDAISPGTIANKLLLVFVRDAKTGYGVTYFSFSTSTGTMYAKSDSYTSTYTSIAGGNSDYLTTRIYYEDPLSEIYESQWPEYLTYHQLMLYRYALNFGDVKKIYENGPGVASSNTIYIPVTASGDWNFNEGSGNIIDQTGGGNNLTVAGTATYNGTHIDINTTTSGNNLTGPTGGLYNLSSFTGFLWIRFNAIATFKNIIQMNYSGTPGGETWGLELNNSTSLGFSAYDSVDLFGKSIGIDTFSSNLTFNTSDLYFIVFGSDAVSDTIFILLSKDNGVTWYYDIRCDVNQYLNSNNKLCVKTGSGTDGINGDYYRLIIIPEILPFEVLKSAALAGETFIYPYTSEALVTEFSGSGAIDALLAGDVTLQSSISGAGSFYERFKPNLLPCYSSIVPTAPSNIVNKRHLLSNTTGKTIQVPKTNNKFFFKGG